MANDYNETREEQGLILPTAAQVIERLPHFPRRHKLITGWMNLTGENPVQLVRTRHDSFEYADLSDGFLDVGANHGLFSFGRHGASVDCHLFEPNPTLAVVIQCHAGAISADAMHTKRACNCGPSGCGGIQQSNERQTGLPHVSEFGELKVPAITLDAYFDETCVDLV
jgi:hypothetical protein